MTAPSQSLFYYRTLPSHLPNRINHGTQWSCFLICLGYPFTCLPLSSLLEIRSCSTIGPSALRINCKSLNRAYKALQSIAPAYHLPKGIYNPAIWTYSPFSNKKFPLIETVFSSYLLSSSLHLSDLRINATSSASQTTTAFPSS